MLTATVASDHTLGNRDAAHAPEACSAAQNQVAEGWSGPGELAGLDP